MALERLEKRLRARARGKTRRSLPREDEVPKWLKRLVVGGGALTLIVVVIGLGLVLFYTAGGRGVVVTLTIPQTVTRGEPFDAQVEVLNNTGASLQNGTIEIDLPANVVNYNGQSANILSDQVGEVGVGGLNKRTYSLLPVGPVGESEPITAVFNYSASGGAEFQDRSTAETTVQSAAFKLTALPPTQILSGSTFSIKVAYENDSDFNFPAMTLAADYPDSFKYDSSDVAPASLNNYWQLGSLAPHASGTVTITGHLIDTASAAVLPLRLSATFGGEDFPLAETSVSLNPSPPPVSLNILVNGTDAYVAKVGDTLNYQIQYQNGSGIALANAAVKATLVGDMLDFSTLSTNGAFSPSAQTVTWNATNAPSLALIPPGGSGEFDVRVALKNRFSASRLSDKNYSVQLSAVMTSPTVPPYLSATRTTAQAMVTTKIAGIVDVSATGYYRDAGSGIVNAGDLPPKVGRTTDFTVHWDITNYSTDISGVTVSAPLPPNATWTGQVKSNVTETPTYDPSRNLVIWAIDSVPAGRGVLSDPVEAVFQVAATPTSDYIGSFEPILGPTSLSATDSYTGLSLQSGDTAVTTALPSDSTVSQSQGIVVP